MESSLKYRPATRASAFSTACIRFDLSFETAAWNYYSLDCTEEDEYVTSLNVMNCLSWFSCGYWVEMESCEAEAMEALIDWFCTTIISDYAMHFWLVRVTGWECGNSY